MSFRRLIVKTSRTARAIALIIVVFLLFTGIGWICNESGLSGNYPPVTTRFAFQVLVIDENGTLVPNQTVYAISCLQKPAGWITPSEYADNDSGYGITDDHGFAEIYSVNYTLTRNDVLWMGASTDESLLAADFSDKSFGTGGWARFNYSDIRHTGEGGITSYARLLLVRNSDGRMIDINRLVQEYGFSFNPDSLIDAFWYMDNRSWNYSA
jgi:hypothetical protein